MATLEENITQAIADFDDIKAAIEEQGVEVPYGTDTSEYGNKIRSIEGGGVGDVDLAYNPESTNAQSGLAVAEALSGLPIKYVVSPDADGNTVFLRSLESGTYVLKGNFKPFDGSGNTCRFSSDLLVNVVKGTLNKVPTSHIQIFYPVHNVVQFCDITDSTYSRRDIKINDLASMATVEEMIAAAAGAYSNALKATASGETIRVDDVSPVEHTVKAKVSGKNLFDMSRFTTTNQNGLPKVVEVGNEYVVLDCPPNAYGHAPTGVKLAALCPNCEAGGTYVLTATSPSQHQYLYLDGANNTWLFGTARVVSEAMLNSFVVLYGYNMEQESEAKACTISNIQLEAGDTATEYEPYINPERVTLFVQDADGNDVDDYVFDADGTLEFPAVSPVMALHTDTEGATIDVEYNQDINKAFQNGGTITVEGDSIKIVDDGKGNVKFITVNVPDEPDVPDEPELEPHTLSGAVVTVEDENAVGLPLEITAGDTATKVFVGGKNLLTINADNVKVGNSSTFAEVEGDVLTINPDKSEIVQQTFVRLFLPMTLPAGKYTMSAVATTDDTKGKLGLYPYNGTTSAGSGIWLTANDGGRHMCVVTATAPFNNIAIFSGEGATSSNGFSATLTEIAMFYGQCETVPDYEEYRGFVHTLPVQDIVVDAVPTFVMADVGDVSVTYYTEAITNEPTNPNEPTTEGAELASLETDNGKYTSFPDQWAREQIRNMPNNSGGVTDKKWEGKMWVCVGDSLTQKMQHAEKYYYEYVSDETGISIVNMGRGGTGYKKLEESNLAFYQRINSVPDNADVVTIFGSGNDVAAFAALNPTAEDFVAYLGTETDKGTDTICGCINTTINNLYAKYPTIRLGIVSPTPWQHNEPTLNCTMAAYSEKLKAICHRRGIPFLDLFRCSGFRPSNEEYKSLVFSGDNGGGTHPNALGHELIAPRFRAFLETLI